MTQYYITIRHMISYNWWKCVLTWPTNIFYKLQLLAQNYAILVVLAHLLTTLVWIECDRPDGSYFLEWWGHIFGFCAKSHIIISFLSEPVSLFILIGCIAFQFFFWVIIDGLFSLPWIFSIDLSFYRKPKKDLVFLSSSSLFHYSRSTFCLPYNFFTI